MSGCKSKNCKFYQQLREYRKSLKLTDYTDYPLSMPDPCMTCKRHYGDGFIPKAEGKS